MTKRVSFQGSPGAYSDMACRTALPDYEPLPCVTFDEAFAAVQEGTAALAMIPVENTVAGRVAAVHHLMPQSGLYAIGEYYQPIEHHLLALPGTALADIKEVRSHVHAIPQCKEWITAHNMTPIVRADTAGSAEEVAKLGDKSVAAIASKLAGDMYGLESLAADIADVSGNTTRFLILSSTPRYPRIDGGNYITTLIYRVGNTPAALFKTLSGFATNGINITRLESYFGNNRFASAQFWIDIEGHIDEKPVKMALDELAFFAESYKILGVYPASPNRYKSAS